MNANCNSNPYAASHDVAEPRSWRNVVKLLLAACVLFVLPSLLVYGYLRYEQAHPTLFFQYEEAAMDRNVEQWQDRANQPAVSTPSP
jgi:hypothetical protein